MSAYLVYIKIVAAVLLLALVAGGSYHVGGMASRTQLEGFQATQAENTAKAVLAERASGAVELSRVNAKLKEFEDAPQIDPVVPGVAGRMLLYASAAGCPVSGASGDSGADRQPGGVPRSDPELERLSQAAFDAASRDAARLNLCREVWPR